MTTATETPRRFPAVQILHLVTFAAFLICVALWCDSLLNFLSPSVARWTEALLPVLSLATTLMGLARTLPVQNVISAAIIISLLSSLVQTVGVKTGIPFGPYAYTDNFGPFLFGVLP